MFSFLMPSSLSVVHLRKWHQSALLPRSCLPQKPIIKAISEKLLLLGASGRLAPESKHIIAAAT